MNARISVNPSVCNGKPVIAGSRVLVSTLLGALSGGDSFEVVLEEYPSISVDDLQAALEFAGELASFDTPA